jgi:hypothetical protein
MERYASAVHVRNGKEFIFNLARNDDKDEKDYERESDTEQWLTWKSDQYDKLAGLLLYVLKCMVVEGKRYNDDTTDFVPEMYSSVSVDNLMFLIYQVLRDRCVELKMTVPFYVDVDPDSIVRFEGGLTKVQHTNFKCECVVYVVGQVGLSMLGIVKQKLKDFRSNIEIHLREQNKTYEFDFIRIAHIKGKYVELFSFDIVANCNCRYPKLRKLVYSMSKLTLKGEYTLERCHFHDYNSYP